MKSICIIFCCLGCLQLSGCAGIGEKIPFFEQMNTKTATPPAELVRNVGSTDRSSDRASAVKVDPGAWVASAPFKIQTIQKLPSVFYEEVSFNRSIVSLYDFSARITNISKIRVRASVDALGVAAQAIRDGAAPLPGLTAAGGGAISSSQGASATGIESKKELQILYKGTLKGLLDTVTARLGIYWTFDGMNIQLFQRDTRTFVLNAPTGDITVTTGMNTSSNSTGGNTGGGATSNLSTNSQLTLWTDVEKNIKTFLSPAGNVSHSKATGTFTVTDIPDVLDRVEDYINTLNESLGKQVVMEINIYAVSLTRDNTQGLDLKALLTRGKQSINMSPVVGGSSSVAITRESGGDTTSFFIQALSSAGATRKVTTATLVASNNQPVPLQVGTQFSYIASQQTTVATTGVAQTTSTVAQLNTGLALMLIPKILDDHSILLQYNLGLSTLKNLRVYSTSTSRLEMPELETRNILQRVNLRSGETLIASGFEDGSDRQGGSGIGDAANPIWGQQTQSGTREVFVITVKPSELASR